MAIPLLVQVGIAVGGLVIQSLLMPRPKVSPVDKGKNNDIRIQGSDYGAYIPAIFGKGRISGNVIFSNGYQEYITTTGGGGGKKNPSPVERNYTYTSNFGLLFTRNQIIEFKRIWKDAEILVSNGSTSTEDDFEAETATLSGGASVASDTNASNGQYATNLGNGGKATFDFNPTSLIPIEPPETQIVPHTRISFYYKCSADRTAVATCISAEIGTAPETVSFLNSSNQWTLKTINVDGYVTDLEFANPSATAPDLDKIAVSYYYTTEEVPNPNFNYKVSGAIDPALTFPLDIFDPSEYYNHKPSADADGKTNLATVIPTQAIRLYTGTATQMPDSAYISWLDNLFGAGNGEDYATAWRGHSLMFAENFVLQDGRLPNFTAEIDEGSNTANAVLEYFFGEMNLSNYDFTATDGLTQVGFYDFQQSSYRQKITALQTWHLFNLAEIGGTIFTIPETAESIYTVDRAELRAHSESEEMPVSDCVVTIKEEQTLLPFQKIVGFLNTGLDYKNDSASSLPFFDTENRNAPEINFPIASSLAEAKLVADRLIKKEYAENKTIEFDAMPSMARYTVGDILTLEIAGTDQTMRVDKVSYSMPVGKIHFTCSSVESSVYETHDGSSRADLDKVANVTISGFPSNSVAIPIISKPVYEKDKGRLGVYLGLSKIGRGDCKAIGLYREKIANTFVLEDVVTEFSPVGDCQDTLGSHTDETVEDTANEMLVYFYDETELETVTNPDLSAYPRMNLIRIGAEWVQFRTATEETLPANSPYGSAWTISNLWRGRFGTEAEMNAHETDETAVIAENLYFYELEKEDVGNDIVIKAVTNGQAEDTARETSFTFSPVSNYTLSNVTETRTLDANSVTLDSLADFVGTMAGDQNL